MNKPYKIRAFDKTSGQVIVEYENLAPMTIDLPITDEGRLPTGNELDSHIKAFLPVWHIERIEKFKLGVNSDDVAAINALVEPFPSVILSSIELAFDARQQRDKLLFSSDWTQLQDVPLSETQKMSWAVYRQELRDLTNQPNFPNSISWPEEP